mmetsp:Transcript_3156/g.4386  ORF Transcript_3156/g.4386 Transcript_3156/m.4386 type:complete len:395 (-) Transcript_3156:257-1441(-)
MARGIVRGGRTAGRGSGGSYTRGRGGKSKDGKKACELGKDCPYQHEHQHQLEYHHDVPVTSKLQQDKPKNIFQATGTSGTKLGSGMSQHPGRSRLLAETEIKQKKKSTTKKEKDSSSKVVKRSRKCDEVIILDDSDEEPELKKKKSSSLDSSRKRSSIIVIDDDDEIDLASASEDSVVEIIDKPKKLRLKKRVKKSGSAKKDDNDSDEVNIIEESQIAHERIRSLRSEQDAEYEASLAADRKKEAMKKALHAQVREEKALEEATRLSKAEEMKRKHKMKAKFDASEPLSSGIRLRLRFPDASFIDRTFPEDALLANVLEFVYVNLPDPPSSPQENENKEEQQQQSICSDLATENDIALADASTHSRYTADKKYTSLNELGFGKAASLFVILLNV